MSRPGRGGHDANLGLVEGSDMAAASPRSRRRPCPRTCRSCTCSSPWISTVLAPRESSSDRRPARPPSKALARLLRVARPRPAGSPPSPHASALAFVCAPASALVGRPFSAAAFSAAASSAALPKAGRLNLLEVLHDWFHRQSPPRRFCILLRRLLAPYRAGALQGGLELVAERILVRGHVAAALDSCSDGR